eukprot:SAG31_NODE_3474_length_4233_cov_5.560716_6_plen_96_part_00
MEVRCRHKRAEVGAVGAHAYVHLVVHRAGQVGGGSAGDQGGADEEAEHILLGCRFSGRWYVKFLYRCDSGGTLRGVVVLVFMCLMRPRDGPAVFK